MQGAIKELQETAIVMAGIQERQSRVLKGQSKWLERHELDKLNGLIGVVDNMVRRRKPQ